MREFEAQRERWIDVAKGLAILLMVFGHVWGGLMTSGVVPRSPFNLGLYAWIYTFHMPAFVFIAGMFLERSLQRGLWGFAFTRFGTLYYPAVVWGLITWLAQSSFRAYINTDPDRRPFANLFYHPDSSYGFLLTLLYLSLAFGFARKMRIPVWGCLLMATAALGYGLATGTDPAIGFGSYGVWLTAGAALRGMLLSASARSSPGLATVALIGFAAVSFGTVVRPTDPRLLYTPFGIAMLLAIAMLLNRALLARTLEICGVYSLEIYLMHSLIWVACRIVLLRFLHVAMPEILVPLLVLCGTGGSIAAARLAERLQAGWAFRLRLRG